jgi:Tfp pilus assembly PilM family ATPase
MNLFRKLISPRLPSAAVGLSAEGACVVSLERSRGLFAVKSAGYTALPQEVLRPHFDEQNIHDPSELAEILAELVTSTGMPKRHRWSVALPESATRTTVLTLEGTPASRGELEEMVRWKTERTVGAPFEELRVSREQLPPDARGGARVLVSAVRLAVLDEYEAVFSSLGWHTGLILPRHMGEAWWLMRDGGGAGGSDSLLVSAHAEGFTALLLRGQKPLLVRNVQCDVEDRNDELYRFVLFYRDRIASANGEETLAEGVVGETIERLLVTGEGLDSHAASEIIAETLNVAPRTLRPEDLRLALPSRDLDFNLLAAPAGLAALAWG